MRVWRGEVDGAVAALFRYPPGGLAFVYPGAPGADWVRPWNTVIIREPGPWIPPGLPVEFGAVNASRATTVEVERRGEWRWAVHAFPNCVLALYLGQGMVLHIPWPVPCRWRVGRAATIAATIAQLGGGV